MRTYLPHAFVLATISLSVPVAHASDENLNLATVEDSSIEIEVFASPTCGCCKHWIGHLEKHGLTVKTEYLADMDAKKDALGVPGKLRSCHTGVVNGLVVEGHVPASDILKTVAFTGANPSSNIAGIAVPGMPQGSPGMETGRFEPFSTIGYTYNGDFGVISQYGAR